MASSMRPGSPRDQRVLHGLDGLLYASVMRKPVKCVTRVYALTFHLRNNLPSRLRKTPLEIEPIAHRH